MYMHWSGPPLIYMYNYMLIPSDISAAFRLYIYPDKDMESDMLFFTASFGSQLSPCPAFAGHDGRASPKTLAIFGTGRR